MEDAAQVMKKEEPIRKQRILWAQLTQALRDEENRSAGRGRRDDRRAAECSGEGHPKRSCSDDREVCSGTGHGVTYAGLHAARMQGVEV